MSIAAAVELGSPLDLRVGRVLAAKFLVASLTTYSRRN